MQNKLKTGVPAMKRFDYNEFPATLLRPELVNLLAAIHEHKGKQDLYIEAHQDVLNSMLEVAKIQSTDASNRIEGIFTSDVRLRELMEEKVAPRNRNEKEIVGYRDVLATIHENYDYIPISPNTILQLHRDLYSFLASGAAGQWKSVDNIIAETNNNGEQFIRFKPVSAFETPEAMELLCNEYNQAIQAEIHDPLLLTVLFVFDFLCIHPFNDGNGRMSRLLTLLLLYRAGYIVGKYISLEYLIEKSKESYYDVLRESSSQWHDNASDYLPFIEYYLGLILKAYGEFENRVEHVFISKLSKAERIRMQFEKKLGKISKRDILEACPDISISMIEITLKKLLEEGYIIKIGSARNTAYVKRT
jgi:Fic family protein